MQPGDILTYDEFGLPVITRSLGTYVIKPSTAKNKFETDLHDGVQIDTGRNLIEAANGGLVAQSQLAADVGSIRATNATRKAFSEHVMDVIRAATGEKVGKAPKDCRDWFIERSGYAKTPKTVAPRQFKETIDQLVPLAYQPEFGQKVSWQSKTIKPPDN